MARIARAVAACQVLLSAAVLGACPAAPGVQDDLSALKPYTAFVGSGGSAQVTAWHDVTTPNLQLYEGTDQTALLFHPTFVPSPPANKVHLRVVTSSACHCTGAAAAGITHGGVVTILSGSDGSPLYTNSAGTAASGVRLNLASGFYKVPTLPPNDRLRATCAAAKRCLSTRASARAPSPFARHAPAPSSTDLIRGVMTARVHRSASR